MRKNEKDVRFCEIKVCYNAANSGEMQKSEGFQILPLGFFQKRGCARKRAKCTFVNISAFCGFLQFYAEDLRRWRKNRHITRSMTLFTNRERGGGFGASSSYRPTGCASDARGAGSCARGRKSITSFRSRKIGAGGLTSTIWNACAENAIILHTEEWGNWNGSISIGRG